MKVKVKFLPPLKEPVKIKERELETGQDSTVEDLLDRIKDKYGRYLEMAYPIVLVNGKGISQLEGEETKLKEGDVVVFISALSGG